jgi:hypothetical protein
MVTVRCTCKYSLLVSRAIIRIASACSTSEALSAATTPFRAMRSAWCAVNSTPAAEVCASGESPTDQSQLCRVRRSAGWYSRCVGCRPPKSCAAAASVARSGARRFHCMRRPSHLVR